MSKKYLFILIILIIVGLAIIGGFSILYFFQKTTTISTNNQCQVKEIIFYYLDKCEWCNKVKSEGTLEKIEGLGVKVKKINAALGPVRHKFDSVPVFVIDGKVYTGYKTLKDLMNLLGCSQESKPVLKENIRPSLSGFEFLGEKGEKAVLENGEVKLDASTFKSNKARFYNVEISTFSGIQLSGKTVYFFVVKDKNEKYRAAANACQACFQQKKGFRQEGSEMVCNNCGNRYPLEKIALEKGGCNPAPINPDLEVKDGKIIVKQLELEEVAGLF